jgi:hypothetical protein
METDKKLECTIVEELATLSESGSWRKQLNIVQWGNNIAKYDIRSWNEDNTKMGKGVTLSLEEIRTLKKALNNLEI